jgi:soluble lytic murein transglycosylase
MLGNYYYSDLRSFLSGFDVSAVAAYNGGAGAIQRWKSSLYYNDTDEFVEQIPYEETQDYVKKVFRSYWNYIRIYSGE